VVRPLSVVIRIEPYRVFLYNLLLKDGRRPRPIAGGIYDYENCTECHRSGDEDEAEYLWKSISLGSGEGEKNSQPSGLKRQERKDHDDG